ncbi:unnamed protein product [Rangifer tarandus platyrhynchus]|uniref:Uncharacterized protein n=1 Tax=Rangifer tarandus platyrhynchus TaxID=3082113 RepID=A0AC59YRR2_RANTA
MAAAPPDARPAPGPGPRARAPELLRTATLHVSTDAQEPPCGPRGAGRAEPAASLEGRPLVTGVRPELGSGATSTASTSLSPPAHFDSSSVVRVVGLQPCAVTSQPEDRWNGRTKSVLGEKTEDVREQRRTGGKRKCQADKRRMLSITWDVAMAAAQDFWSGSLHP